MKHWVLGLSLLGNVVFLVVAWWTINRLGGWSYLQFRLKNQTITSEYQHKTSTFETMPMSTGNIIMLGNSLTAGIDWGERLGRKDIINRGIPGDGIQGVLARLPEIARHQPTQLWLMIGINDLGFHNPKWLKTQYPSLFEAIQTTMPQTKVFVQSLLPVNNAMRHTGIENTDILEINEFLKENAEKWKYQFVDIHPLLLDDHYQLSPQWTTDGIHLNGGGYTQWVKALEPLFNVPTDVSNY